MGNIFQHHNIDTTQGTLLAVQNSYVGASASNEFWGKNALQTITVTRNIPRDPQQAVGHRGIVDYTSGQITTDLTLDCILTEQTEAAVEGDTSIYEFAENQATAGEESYVLTSCNVGFTAGAPATVSYGYITAGLGTALDASANPDVLKDGEEAYFAVVMGDDGSGVELVSKSGGLWVEDPDDIVLPSGVQSLTFNSTINKDNILDVRAAQPIYFVTTYPVDVTVDIETYDKSASGGSVGFDAASLATLGVKCKGLTNQADRSSYTAPSRDPGADFSAATKNLVLATGMVKVSDAETVNVGGYLTYTYSYQAADLSVPLKYYSIG